MSSRATCNYYFAALTSSARKEDAAAATTECSHSDFVNSSNDSPFSSPSKKQHPRVSSDIVARKSAAAADNFEGIVFKNSTNTPPSKSTNGRGHDYDDDDDVDDDKNSNDDDGDDDVDYYYDDAIGGERTTKKEILDDYGRGSATSPLNKKQKIAVVVRKLKMSCKTPT